MADSTPRVSRAYMGNFVGRPAVRMIGTVTSLSGQTATVDCHGSVTVLLNHNSHLAMGQTFELIGQVVVHEGDLRLKLLSATSFGSNIDMKAVAAVVEATHKYPEIFYSS